MCCLLIIFLASLAQAGLFEVGISGSYRESFIRKDINSKSSSITGSFSYYYMERSAVQLSFTQGVRRENTPLIDTNTNETRNELNITEVNIYGADLIVSFADRKATFQPFIKAGVAQVDKKFTKQIENQEADQPVSVAGLSLSGGFGIKVLLTQRLSINFTVDGWTAPISEDYEAIDSRVLGGLSWFL